MSKKEQLLTEIERLPDTFIEEILDFALFLRSRVESQVIETAVLSESSLKKDWLNEEEDKAWENL